MNPSVPLLSLLVLAGDLKAASTPFQKAPVSEKTMAAHAAGKMKSTEEMLSPQARMEVESEVVLFDATPDGALRASVRSAALEMAGYADPGLVWAAYAVKRSPGDANLANNLGAYLLERGMLSEAIEAFLYASVVDPKSAPVWTNLGSAALDQSDLKRAKAFFEKALVLEPSHSGALIGLATCYMVEHDLAKAFELFIRANGISYRFAATERIDKPDEKGETQAPSKPIMASSSSASGQPEADSGSSRVTSTDISLPLWPDFSGPDAFIAAAASRQRAASVIAKAGGDAMDRMLKSADLAISASRATVDRLSKMSRTEREAYGKEQASQDTEIPFTAARESWALKKNYDWAGKRLTVIDADYTSAMEPQAEIAKKMADLANTSVKRACNNAMDPKACQADIVAHCKAMRSLTLQQWGLFKRAFSRKWSSQVDVLTELYRAQASWIRLTQDKQKWDSQNDERQAFIYSSLGMLFTEEDVRRMAFAGMGVASFGSAERCPDEPLPQAKVPETPDAKLAATKRVPCPFEKQPLDLSGTIPGSPVKLRVQLGCNSAKLSVKGGPFEGSAKRTFRTHATEIHLGVGVDQKVDQAGLTVKGEIKGTVDITLQRNGGATMTTGFEASVKADLFKVASVSVEAGIASDFLLRAP